MMDWQERKRLGGPWVASKWRAGKTHGEAIPFSGTKCPVNPGTPVSVWYGRYKWWVPSKNPEHVNWQDVVAYRLRGATAPTATPGDELVAAINRVADALAKILERLGGE